MPQIYNIVVVAPMWTEYASGLLEGGRSYAREHQDLRVTAMPLHRYGESPLPRSGKGVSGLLVLASEEDRWVEELWRSGLPVVNCSVDLNTTGIPTMTPDRISGKAVDYLADLGRRELALVCPDFDRYPGFRPLFNTFSGLVAERGLGCHVFAKCEVDPGDFPARIFEPEQETELGDFLENLPKPAGVWCPNDDLAALVCQVASLRGVSVPASLAVLGSGNTRVAQDADPPISSFPLPSRAVGYEGMRLLHRLVKGEELGPDERITLIQVPPIIERASTRMSGNDLALDRARDMILNQACNGITINEVVASVPMCRMTFHNRYKEAFGCTPGEDRRQVRLDTAKRLLETSNMGITQIAHACGFDEPNKFYVFFKRETSKSPTEWRSR